MPSGPDLLVCAISGKLHRAMPDADIVVREQHPDFASMGLPFASLIRYAYLTTVPLSAVQDPIGKVSDGTYARILSQLATYLKAQ